MIRKATLDDAAAMHQLINAAARQGQMLGRALVEIYENIRDYYVAVDRKRIIGVCGMHVKWEDLAEIKSLAVAPSHQKKGLGRQLVEACIAEGLGLGVRRFYALTYVGDFFKRLGFKKVSRERLPQKVWSECIRCHKFPDCDEIPMLLNMKNPSERPKPRGSRHSNTRKWFI
jgi:amino-acid N-acetyltransferase